MANCPSRGHRKDPFPGCGLTTVTVLRRPRPGRRQHIAIGSKPEGSPMNPNMPQKSAAAAAEPLKHVIAEYKHRTETVTCVCGWHGSSAAVDGGSSPWNA